MNHTQLQNLLNKQVFFCSPYDHGQRIWIRNLLNKQVFCGYPYGQRTKGTILKVNINRCKIRQDEERSDHPIGTIWNVPFDLINMDESVSNFWLMDHKHEIIILSKIYAELYALCGYGERPTWQIQRVRADLEQKLRACFVLLDRMVSESECYEYNKRIGEFTATYSQIH